MRDRAAVAEAMERAGRARFLPPATRPHAATDAPLTIGHGATCSQPTTVATMLELLDVPVGARVLDVGSGSGWTTAILAHLVGPAGRVLAVELVPELVEHSRAALDRQESARAEIRVAEQGVLGAPEDAPFDRILVSAMSDAVPGPLSRQLAVGGVMVVPAGGRLVRVSRTEDGWDEEAAPGGYVFVPLR